MKTHNIIIGFFLLLSSSRSVGQADSILALPQAAQTQALFTWYEEKASMDTTWFLSRIDQMHKDFMKAGREDLARETWAIRHYYLMHYIDEARAIAMFDHALTRANERGWKIQEAELYIHKGLLFRTHGRQVNAFENFMKGYELMSQTGFAKFPLLHKLLYSIGISYFYVKAYDQAVIYLKDAVELPLYRPDPKFATVTYNALGLCYMRQLQYDSAIVAFKKAHDHAVESNMVEYAGLTLGNIGYAHFKLGDDSTALPLLEEDFRVSIQTEEYNSAMNASLALSTIYLKRGLQDKAQYHVDFVSKHINRSDDRAMKSYFDNLADLREISGDFKSALAYRDSSAFYLERIQASEEKDILERARLELEIQKHATATTSLEALRKRQILLRNGLLVIMALTGIIILSMIQRRYLLRKRELEQAQKELTMFTDVIREKNEMLDTFSQEIETLRATDEHSRDERSHHLTALMNSHILTEDDWRQFKILFDKVHPDFFVRLKEKMPDLTAAETRLLALTKLQLAPREMASMLGISYDSILKSRQRLRKKINLPEEGTLDELLKML